MSLTGKMTQQMGAMNAKIQEQRNAEEQERMRQIQLKIEGEKKAKEAEEQKIREEEETRRKKVCSAFVHASVYHHDYFNYSG